MSDYSTQEIAIKPELSAVAAAHSIHYSTQEIAIKPERRKHTDTVGAHYSTQEIAIKLEQKPDDSRVSKNYSTQEIAPALIWANDASRRPYSNIAPRRILAVWGGSRYTKIMAMTTAQSSNPLSSGMVLLLATIGALLFVNLGGATLYQQLLDYRLTLGLAPVALEKTLHHWINDGLMVLFFFLVGLEIKGELQNGILATRAQALLPVCAAVGGMLFPALVYVTLNYNHPEALAGWAIPAATDIAFALSIIALLGKRVPLTLKLLLTAIAVLDDLGAVLIIAFFYTPSLDTLALAVAGVIIGVLYLLNRRNVTQPLWYALVGFLLWLALIKAGVHGTIAGVITALFVQSRHTIEQRLYFPVYYCILPLFAFANAGIVLHNLPLVALIDPIPLGIIGGLVLGKPLGIMTGITLARYAGIPLPASITTGQLWGMALLCGIGFTMSLFIGQLAFAAHPSLIVETRLGILTGSLIAALVGLTILARATKAGRPE